MADFEIVTGSAEETIELGRKVAKAFKGGEVVSLVGNLGSGKTHFIKGVSAGLGVEEDDQVNSPTFVLINEYFGQSSGLQIYHIDAYRIDDEQEFEALAFDDICYPGSVVLIEWADKVKGVLRDVETVEIELSHVGENERRILFRNVSEELIQLIIVD